MSYINGKDRKVRIALPSKGRLSEDSLKLMEESGLAVKKTNERQYMARIPAMPEVEVLFQRVGDIALSVRDGIVDFGITGLDVVSETQNESKDILVMLEKLGFGNCKLCAIVPEASESVSEMKDVMGMLAAKKENLRVATKFPKLTRRFFEAHNIFNVDYIQAEGALEIAPLIGYADMISDLVSSGLTLRDNRLKVLDDGLILESQACLIANRYNLVSSPRVMEVARRLLEFIVAYLRAQNNVTVFANIRGDSPEAVAKLILGKKVIRGLQGPTISRVITHQGENWFAVNLVIQKSQLADAINELRSIGGSGVVVTPVNFIFEEEPEAYTRLLAELKVDDAR
ncbi:MAG TPA: ATP phosphoribosyltransferase [Brevefilum sp.]